MAEPAEYPGMPRWLKIAGIVAIVVIVLGIAAAFLMGGEHGPGRHMGP